MDIERLETAYKQHNQQVKPFAVVDNCIQLNFLQNNKLGFGEKRKRAQGLTQTACGTWVDENEEKEPWLEF
jgi:hypothetical protein